MATYNPAINYYRVNQNNQAIAASASGASAGPTEEIAAPLASAGTFASILVNVITGNATTFNSTFAEGQYLYYIDNSGNYVLVGQIDTITNATTLDLVAGTLVNTPTANSVLAATYSLITSTESFYIRVATDKTSVGLGATEAYIPDLSVWRQSNSATALNNISITRMQAVSNVGVPTSDAATLTDIFYTLAVQNTFTPGQPLLSSPTSWNSLSDIPDYIWLLANPVTDLSSITMYRISTEESLVALTVTPRTLNSVLRTAGYYNVSTGGTGEGV